MPKASWDVAHYFIAPEHIDEEIARVRNARNAVAEEISRLQLDLPKDAPPELDALLDVQLMLLQDEQLVNGVRHWVTQRHYNGEWALTTQFEHGDRRAQHGHPGGGRRAQRQPTD